MAAYGRSTKVDRPHEAVARVKEAFQEQGFGTLTEIDVQATLEQKIDEHIEPYTILGVCNPGLARRALEIDRSIGLLLPCTVVVRGEGSESTVEAMEPEVLVRVAEQPDLKPIADEASASIDAAFASLG